LDRRYRRINIPIPMIFVPIMYLVALPSYVLHGILAALTATVPSGVWTVLDYIFAVPRQFDGTFPFMVSLTQGILFFFSAWVLHAMWRVFNSIMSYMPSWFPGTQGRMPEKSENYGPDTAPMPLNAAYQGRRGGRYGRTLERGRGILNRRIRNRRGKF